MDDLHVFPESPLLSIADAAELEVLEGPCCLIPTHWQSSLTLISVLRGEFSGSIEQRPFQLSAGQCACVSPYALYSLHSMTGGSALLLRIPISALSRVMPDEPARQFGWDAATASPAARDAMAHIQHSLLQLRNAVSSPSPFRTLRQTSLLLDIAYWLCESLSRPMDEADIRAVRNRQRLSPVIAYTDAHLCSEIALNDAAAALPMHPNAFCRFFRENTGMTYLNYVNEQRLAKVSADLLATDTPLQDLLSAHGFTNYKLFRRLFSERFHTTPGQLRNALQNAKD